MIPQYAPPRHRHIVVAYGHDGGAVSVWCSRAVWVAAREAGDRLEPCEDTQRRPAQVAPPGTGISVVRDA